MDSYLIRCVDREVIIIITLLRCIITRVTAIVKVLFLANLLIELFCCFTALVSHPQDSFMIILQLLKCFI
jgi:hypothetical protein